MFMRVLKPAVALMSAWKAPVINDKEVEPSHQLLLSEVAHPDLRLMKKAEIATMTTSNPWREAYTMKIVGLLGKCFPLVSVAHAMDEPDVRQPVYKNTDAFKKCCKALKELPKSRHFPHVLSKKTFYGRAAFAAVEEEGVDQVRIQALLNSCLDKKIVVQLYFFDAPTIPGTRFVPDKLYRINESKMKKELEGLEYKPAKKNQ